jgi:hypothetical protein
MLLSGPMRTLKVVPIGTSWIEVLVSVLIVGLLVAIVLN